MRLPGQPGESVRCTYRRLVTSLRGEVRLMGNRQGKKFLRFLICFIIVLLVMIYISPKAK